MEQSEIARSLGRIEGRLDGIMDAQQRALTQSELNSSRLNVLENGHNRTLGLVSGIAAAVSLAIGLVRETLWSR
jgi:hypothetical protein